MIAVARRMKDFQYDPAVDPQRLASLSYPNANRSRIPPAGASGAGLERLPVDAEWLAQAEQVPQSSSVEFDQHWNREWEQNLWDAAIARVKEEISPKQFQMFSLYVMKERPAEEIAKSLGVRVAQVYLAKHRITALLSKGN